MSDAAFPAVGRTFAANFGGAAFRLDFAADGEAMTFSTVGEQAEGLEGGQTVTYAATAVTDQVFLVSWQESAGTTVTHVEDFGRGLVWSNITTPDGQFLRFSGTLTPVE